MRAQEKDIVGVCLFVGVARVFVFEHEHVILCVCVSVCEEDSVRVREKDREKVCVHVFVWVVCEKDRSSAFVPVVCFCAWWRRESKQDGVGRGVPGEESEEKNSLKKVRNVSLAPHPASARSLAMESVTP